MRNDRIQNSAFVGIEREGEINEPMVLLKGILQAPALFPKSRLLNWNRLSLCWITCVRRGAVGGLYVHSPAALSCHPMAPEQLPLAATPSCSSRCASHGHALIRGWEGLDVSSLSQTASLALQRHFHRTRNKKKKNNQKKVWILHFCPCLALLAVTDWWNNFIHQFINSLPSLVSHLHNEIEQIWWITFCLLLPSWMNYHFTPLSVSRPAASSPFSSGRWSCVMWKVKVQLRRQP